MTTPKSLCFNVSNKAFTKNPFNFRSFNQFQMEKLPVPLTEWGFNSKNVTRHGIKWSPCGLLAVFQGRIVTVLEPLNDHIDPILSFDPFGVDVTTVSWCTGTDNDGVTPLHLLVTSSSQAITIVDVGNFRPISSVFLDEGVYAVASVWSLISSISFFIADNRGNVTMYQLIGQECSPIWSLHVPFAIDFLALSPFMDNRMVVAARDGTFQVIDAAEAKFMQPPGQFPLQGLSLSDCRFYPFLADTLLFVAATGVSIYRISEDAIVHIFQGTVIHEPILNIEFDYGDESVFLIIHETHAREYFVNESGFTKRTLLPFLSQPSNTPVPLLASSMFKNTLAVLSCGGIVQVAEFYKHRIRAQLVYKTIPSEPIDYDLIGDQVVVGSDDSYISVMRDQVMVKSFKFMDGMFSAVRWVGKNAFVAVVVKDNERKKAYYVNIETMAVKSLLTTSIESLRPTDIDIVVSATGKYYALIISKSIILVYADAVNFAKIFEDESVCVTFSDWRDEEIWSISNSWHARKYQLMQDREIFACTRNALLKDKPKAKPTSAAALNGQMLIGTDRGTVAIIDWYGNDLKIIDVCKSMVKSMIVRKNVCLITNGAGYIILLECNDEFEITKTRLKQKVEHVRWIDDSHALVKFPEKNSLTTVNLTDLGLHLLWKDKANINQQEVIERIRGVRDIRAICDILRKGGYYLLSEIMLSLLPTYYSQLSCGANFSFNKAKLHLYIISGMFSRSHKEILGTQKARLELLLGHNQQAIDLFCETPPDSDSFAINVMKAALVGCHQDRMSLAPAVASLMGGDLCNDAIDLLILCGQYKEAAKILAEIGDIEFVFQIAKSQLDESEYDRVLDSLAKSLIAAQQGIRAAAVMVASRKFDVASQILKNDGYFFLSQVIGSIQSDGQRIKFSFP